MESATSKPPSSCRSPVCRTTVQRIKADDTLVLVSRFEMQPVEGAQGDAELDLTVDTAQTEQLTLDGAWVMADYDGGPRCRMLLKSDQTQDGDRLTAADGSVQYRAKLSAEHPRRTLDVIIPYITISEPQPARLQLLALIRAAEAGESCACDLTEPLGLSQPTVSHHLKVLTEAGLLTREKRGTWAWYAVVPDRLDEIAAVFR